MYFYIIIAALFFIFIISFYKIFEKADQPNWAIFIPIYNVYIFTKVIKKSGWWVLLLLIPYLNIVFNIWSFNLLSKSFGKNELFTLGLVLFPFIFFPVLAFGRAIYK
ncbi:MAG: signal peptidase I [Bacteroidales bacterium]|nr:signal peptidase I [Bacteroidales bacterium]